MRVPTGRGSTFAEMVEEVVTDFEVGGWNERLLDLSEDEESGGSAELSTPAQSVLFDERAA